MVGDSEIGIAPSGHIDDAVDSLVELTWDEAKVLGLSALDCFRNDRAPGTHGVSA